MHRLSSPSSWALHQTRPALIVLAPPGGPKSKARNRCIPAAAGGGHLSPVLPPSSTEMPTCRCPAHSLAAAALRPMLGQSARGCLAPESLHAFSSSSASPPPPPESFAPQQAEERSKVRDRKPRRWGAQLGDSDTSVQEQKRGLGRAAAAVLGSIDPSIVLEATPEHSRLSCGSSMCLRERGPSSPLPHCIRVMVRPASPPVPLAAAAERGRRGLAERCRLQSRGCHVTTEDRRERACEQASRASPGLGCGGNFSDAW